jgi:hypothetical protein
VRYTLPRLVGEFPVKSNETLRVYLQHYKRRMYINIRAWVLSEEGEMSELCPTPKGITLSVELLPELLRILAEAQRRIEEAESAREKGEKDEK